MARKSPQALKAEQAADTQPDAFGGVGNDRLDRIDTSIPLVDPSPELPGKPVQSTLTTEEQVASEPEQFKVAKDCKYVGPNGLVTTIRANKVVDSRHYHLEQLLAQGVVLLPVVKE